MARNYTPQGSYKDIQVLSPTAVVDTMVLTAYTRPSNIYYEVNVPMEAYNAGSGPEYLDTTALGLENLAASPDVRSVHFTTDLDNSGLIVDSAVATVGITPPMGASGPFTTEVQFALGILASDPAIYEALVPPAIAAAVKQLEDLAAS